MKRNAYQSFPISDPDQEENIREEDSKPSSSFTKYHDDNDDDDIVKPAPMTHPRVSYVSSNKNDKVTQKLAASSSNFHLSSSSTSFVSRAQYVSNLDQRIARKQQQQQQQQQSLYKGEVTASIPSENDDDDDDESTASSRRRRSESLTASSVSTAVSASSEYEKRIQQKQQMAAMPSTASSSVASTKHVDDYERRIEEKNKKMAASSSSSAFSPSTNRPKPGTFDRVSDLDERISRKTRGLPANDPPSATTSPPKPASKPGAQFSYTKKEEDRTNIKSAWVKDDLFDPNHTPDHSPVQPEGPVHDISDEEDSDHDHVDGEFIDAHEQVLFQKLASSGDGKKSKGKTPRKNDKPASLIPSNTLNPDLHAAAMIGAVPTRHSNDEYNERLRRKQGWVSDVIFDPNTRITHTATTDNNADGHDANDNEEETTASSVDEFRDEPTIKDDAKKSVKFSPDICNDENGNGNTTLSASQNQANTNNMKYTTVQQEEEQQPGAFNISRRAFRRIPGMFQRQLTRTSNNSGSGFLSFRSTKSKKGFGSIAAIDADVELSNPDLKQPQQESICSKLCRDKTNIMTGIIILSIVMSAIIVPVVLSKKGTSNDTKQDESSILYATQPPVIDSTPPTFSPIQISKIYEDYYNALLQISSQDKLQNSTHPQGKALNFLTNQDLTGNGDPETKILTKDDLTQRYALLVLYYHYGDIYSIKNIKNKSVDIESILASKHVCDWNHHIIKCRTDVISAGGKITSLDMGNEETTVSVGNHGLRKLSTISETVERRVVTELIIKGQDPLMRDKPLISEIGLLTNLEILNLSNNALVGRLPHEIYKLKNLRELVLSDNDWKAPLDPRIGEFPHLRTLSMERSKLLGSIPTTLQNLSELENLLLHNNDELYGEILDILSPLSKLVNVDCLGNDFFGSIPTFIGTWSNLEYFNVGNNEKINGKIPTEIGKLKLLEYFNIKSTGIHGNIPTEMGDCESLEGIIANDCLLNGNIPKSLGNLSNLTHLLLHRNRLEGKIPNDLGNLESLEVLSLFNNDLSGEVPYTFGQFKNLTELYLQGNILTGHIHPNICNLRHEQLKKLDADSAQCDNIDESCCT